MSNYNYFSDVLIENIPRNMRNSQSHTFGKPNPIQHYRLGRYMPTIEEIDGVQVDTNIYKKVNSSTMPHSIRKTIDQPGGFTITPSQIIKPPMDCTQENKARIRSRSASTLYAPRYYGDNRQYLKNRCKTFEQRQFNFERTIEITSEEIETLKQLLNVSSSDEIIKLIKSAKPGSPLSLYNKYNAKCYPNTEIKSNIMNFIIQSTIQQSFFTGLITNEERTNLLIIEFKTVTDFIEYIISNFEISGPILEIYRSFILSNNEIVNQYVTNNLDYCTNVVYKPNNHKYAKQGAVDSSLRTYKISVDEINKNSHDLKENISYTNFSSNESNVPFIYKLKGSPPLKTKCVLP